mgnify:CR=1 FL=1
MNKVPLYKIGNEESQDYIEVLELQERTDYDTSKPHKHSYVEVFLFTKGGGSHEIDFVSYPIKSNSVHFVFPNQVHKVARELDTFGHVILLSKEYFGQLDYDLFVQFFHAFYLNPAIEIPSSNFKVVLDGLTKIKEELSQQKSYYKEIAKGSLAVLFHHFLRSNETENESGNRSSKEFKIYMDLLILIDEHFKEHQAVSFYSDALHITSRTLNSICKEFSDATCSTLVSERIVLEAKKLLIYTDQPIKDTMYALNFNDPAYFNRFFKVKTGHTPTEFIQQFAKKYHQ